MRQQRLMEDFRDVLDFYGLKYMGYVGFDFTWSNKKNGLDLVQERLDKGVCYYD